MGFSLRIHALCCPKRFYCHRWNLIDCVRCEIRRTRGGKLVHLHVGRIYSTENHHSFEGGGRYGEYRGGCAGKVFRTGVGGICAKDGSTGEKGEGLGGKSYGVRK